MSASFIAWFKNALLPIWATDSGAEKDEPSLAQKEDGWKAGFRPPAGWENWRSNNVYQWLQYFQYLIFDNIFPIEMVDGWNDDISDACFVRGISSLSNHFWVMVGQNGIACSPNGIAGWKDMDGGGAATGIFAACCSAFDGVGNQRKGLVVGHTGRIRWSGDGFETATAGTPAGGYTGSFEGCLYTTSSAHPNRSFACGQNGEIQYSDNLVTWTKGILAAPGSSQTFRAMAEGGVGSPPAQRILAVGNSASIWYSDDGGANWTQATAAAGYTGDFYGAAFGPANMTDPDTIADDLRYVICGTNGEVQWSYDCITWYRATDAPLLGTGKTLRAVEWTYSAGFVIVGADYQRFSSNDGDKWIAHMHYGVGKPSACLGNFNGIGTDGSMILIVGQWINADPTGPRAYHTLRAGFIG